MVSETHSSIQSRQHYEGSKIPASSEKIYLGSIFCLRGLCYSNEGPLQTHIQLPTQKWTKNNLTRNCIMEKKSSKMNSSTASLQLIQWTTKFTGGREKPWVVQEIFTRIFKKKWREGIEWRSMTAILLSWLSNFLPSPLQFMRWHIHFIWEYCIAKWKNLIATKYLPSQHFNELLWIRC